jgi:3-oxoacyl-[acyl-carrier-protein] synthase-3
MGIRIEKTASYLPKKVVDNFYFETFLDTSDDWISSRTGIKQRHFVEDSGIFDLIEKTIVNLNLSQEEIRRVKTIVVVTCTTSFAIPNLASQVQERFGFSKETYSLDINMGCSGFVAGLKLVEGIIKEGECALLIGAEVLSQILDFSDRNTAVLFGDGAGAVLLEYSKKNSIFSSGTKGNKRVLSYDHPTKGLHMEGREVYKFAVTTIGKSIDNFLKINNIKKEDINYFISHQANIRILETLAKNLNISMDKFPSNIERVGNTSSASIPILLDEINRESRLKHGDKILFFAFGAGLTWALAYLEW